MSAGLSVSYCDLPADLLALYPGANNVSVDPLFMNVGAQNFHLRRISPCVNSGDPALTVGPLDWDIDGQPRILAGRVDIGCDEYQ